jgi:CDP-diacylglycerol--glycerol-3-phosphate 3-phosphatidyltransferase
MPATPDPMTRKSVSAATTLPPQGPTIIAAIPHLVTISRGLAVFGVAWLLHQHPGNAASYLFLAAVTTDLVDGWLARRIGSETRIGLLLDPMADKLLFTGTWLALWSTGRAPQWLAGAMIFRDIIVMAGWATSAARGHLWKPSKIGQIMVAYEAVALTVLLFHGPWLDVHWHSVGVVIGGIALALSIASLVGYAIAGPRSTCSPPPSPQM